MVRTLVLFLLIISGLTSLHATDELSTQIANFNDEVKHTLNPEYINNCASIESKNKIYAPSTFEKSKVYSKLNKKNIELSVLSEAHAREVFNELKNDPENSFEYPLDGCYARAHRMAMQMDKMGITSGKAFIEGDNIVIDTKIGTIEWSYHVASLVMIKVGNKLVPSVLDPALFDKPVSYEEWKKRIFKRPESNFRSEYFTKKFNMDPDSRYEDRTAYDAKEIEDTKDDLRKYKITYEGLKALYPEDYE